VNLSNYSAVFRIYHRGECIGCVLLDREVAESLLGARWRRKVQARSKQPLTRADHARLSCPRLGADGVPCEFIVLSGVLEPNLKHRVLPAKWDEYIDAVQDGGVDDGVHEPAYNVMLIERKGGIAYRVGLGQVHKAGWGLAGPVRKEIELG